MRILTIRAEMPTEERLKSLYSIDNAVQVVITGPDAILRDTWDGLFWAAAKELFGEAFLVELVEYLHHQGKCSHYDGGSSHCNVTAQKCDPHGKTCYLRTCSKFFDNLLAKQESLVSPR